MLPDLYFLQNIVLFPDVDNIRVRKCFSHLSLHSCVHFWSKLCLPIANDTFACENVHAGSPLNYTVCSLERFGDVFKFQGLFEEVVIFANDFFHFIKGAVLDDAVENDVILQEDFVILRIKK